MRIRIDPLDKLFSEFVRKRANGYCERCGQWSGWKRLQCAHFHGRAEHSVRWDEDNACALCMGCHVYIDSHPLEKVDFFKTRLNGKMELLEGRRRNKPDRKLLTIYYKAKIKEVETKNECNL